MYSVKDSSSSSHFLLENLRLVRLTSALLLLKLPFLTVSWSSSVNSISRIIACERATSSTTTSNLHPHQAKCISFDPLVMVHFLTARLLEMAPGGFHVEKASRSRRANRALFLRVAF